MHTLTEDRLEKTWSETVTESVKSFLGSKPPERPPDEPLSINTLITSRRIHVPNVGLTGSLSQGTIETKNNLGYVLMHLHDGRGMVGITNEERSFVYQHLEEIRDNAEIRRYIDLQQPWQGYTWEKLCSLIERQRDTFAVNLKSSELTEARAKALEQYMPQKIKISASAPLDHSQTQEAIKKVTPGEAILIPPKNKQQPAGGLGILAVGGVSEIQKAENEEHARFSAEAEKRTTEYYESLGISDLQLDCPHRASSKVERVRDTLTGLRESYVCGQCGVSTPREKLLAQVSKK